MTLKTLIKVIGIISALFIFTAAHGQSRTNSYQYLANTAGKIVTGRINDRTAITYELEGKILVCGWLLNIEVSKSWKGGADNFNVFSTNSDILLDNDMEYFFIAQKNYNYHETKQNIAFVNCDGLNSVRMNVSGFKYFATSLKQRIFPIISYNAQDNIIDESSNNIKRGQWMLILNRLSNLHLPSTIRRRRINTGNEKIIEEMSFSDFINEFISRS